MKEVWIVQTECGDYYCGCGGGHIIGVSETVDGAEALREDAMFRRNDAQNIWGTEVFGPFSLEALGKDPRV